MNRATELARCDAEIAHCWNHECQPGEWLGVTQGWADWNVERMMILEEQPALDGEA